MLVVVRTEGRQAAPPCADDAVFETLFGVAKQVLTADECAGGGAARVGSDEGCVVLQFDDLLAIVCVAKRLALLGNPRATAACTAEASLEASTPPPATHGDRVCCERLALLGNPRATAACTAEASSVCSHSPAPVASYTTRRYRHVFTADIRAWITSRVRVASRGAGHIMRARFVYARWGSRRRRQDASLGPGMALSPQLDF
jgi:hypothetical protein